MVNPQSSILNGHLKNYMYSVKEIFYTLQGEGARTGRPAVFMRFAGCNLWSGREEDREKAICTFCDTDFVGTDGSDGGKYRTADELATKIKSLWPGTGNPQIKPYIVCTGGEPLLQLDTPLIDALHDAGFEIAIETNGTMEVPQGIDWICMSPKPNTEIKVRKGNELKFIYPQKELDPHSFSDYEFDHFYIQPMDNSNLEANIRQSLSFCLSNPQWKLSLQTHKMLGIR
jgi:7-carboxy-7-deazaguanine synthase